MKKLVLTCLMFALSVNMLLASNPVKTPQQKLRNQIVELLKNPDFQFENEMIQARIDFTFNTKGEIVVLSIDTDNRLLDGYIKNKLNYKQVSLVGLSGGKFQMNIKVVK